MLMHCLLVPLFRETTGVNTKMQSEVVAVVELARPEEELATLIALNVIIVFLEMGSLPEEDKRAQVIALTQPQ